MFNKNTSTMTTNNRSSMESITLSEHSLIISGSNEYYQFYKKNSNSDLSKKSTMHVESSNFSNYSIFPTFTTIDLSKDFGIEVTSRKYNGRTSRSVYVKKVSCGEGFTFILLSDNRVFSRGLNRYGQLGLGHRNNASTNEDGFHQVTAIHDTILDIQCGADFTLFFTKNSDIYGVGCNSFGKLGVGFQDNSTVIVPKRVKSTAFDFRKIESMACGLHHVIYITEDREVVVCGANFRGQLGQSHSSDIYVPEKCVTFTTKNAVSASCGEDHSAILTTCGDVYMSGSFKKGQFNCLPQTSLSFASESITSFTKVQSDCKDVICGAFSTIFLKKDHSIYVCGDNTYSNLAISNFNVPKLKRPELLSHIFTNQTPTHICAAKYHSIIIFDDSRICGSGKNVDGILGGSKDLKENQETKFLMHLQTLSKIKGFSLRASSSYHHVIYYWTKQVGIIEKYFYEDMRLAEALSDVTIVLP
ncbi:hypothetical protein C9374_007985 [Naegleria lovaniensis]|uniref:Uncharacterized protein n=1 Tax=Naegleria lovaniensis TaxID=51637 RepID=A0AA88KG29_NAELO|nr:uncharacterized protein C9374_007985 [Naegleria lovaniensis]KAG2378837.1 hypothetical protein C9374_007985 [Naegleria lovaniensis]